uniref:Uncharacterized protein n=1 Tax=candidate division CPR3 bacterium TaxID=2268181 RepID=A0A7V3J9A8_UNCC3
MFTKAYVLSETDFRGFVVAIFDDLHELISDERGMSERLYETEADIEDYFIYTYEGIIEDGNVDMMMIFCDGEWKEVDTGEKFVDLVRRKYGKELKKVLRDVE